MELKHVPESCQNLSYRLLIVPYGIETFFISRCDGDREMLLIVPYGIETA